MIIIVVVVLISCAGVLFKRVDVYVLYFIIIITIIAGKPCFFLSPQLSLPSPPPAAVA